MCPASGIGSLAARHHGPWGRSAMRKLDRSQRLVRTSAIRFMSDMDLSRHGDAVISEVDEFAREARLDVSSGQGCWGYLIQSEEKST